MQHLHIIQKERKCTMSKYFKASAFILLYLAVYFAVQIAVMFLYSIVYIINFYLQNKVISDDVYKTVLEGILKNTTPCLLVSIVISIPIYILITKLKKERFIDVCGFKRISPAGIGINTLTGMAMAIFILYILAIIDSIYPLKNISGDYEDLMNTIMSGNFVIVFITVGILGPIIEEIIFRGLVLSELRKVTHNTSAVIIQGVLFGIYHLNPLQAMYASVIGIVLGYVMLRYKTLWAPILVHIFFNSLNILLDKMLSEQHAQSYGAIYFLLSTMFIIILTVYEVSMHKKSRKEAIEFSDENY